MKRYKAIGFAQIKDGEEWHALRDDAIFDLPDNIDPYIDIIKQFSQTFSHWLIEFKEIKIEKS